MKKISLTPSLTISIMLSIALLALTMFEESLFNLLSLDTEKVSSGELWRLLTANLVHFGWVHTAMNTAALLLCTLAFFIDDSAKKFFILFCWCCFCVGLGIYLLNPEYKPYAGLSGAIHGLIVAGLLQTRAYPVWIRSLGLILVIAKLTHENSVGYHATDLQSLIPAAVAVESHTYGAIAGLIFTLGNWIIAQLKRSK